MREISSAQEAFLATKLREIDERFDGLKEIEDEDHREYYADLWLQEENRYSTTWAAIARRSLFLAVCSSFELHLIHLANSYAADCQSPFRVRDLADSGIRGCKLLFVKLWVDDPASESAAFGTEWETVTTLYEVRNRIAHSGGKVDKGLATKMGSLSQVFDLSKIKKARDEEDKEVTLLGQQKREAKDPKKREELTRRIDFLRRVYASHQVEFAPGGISAVCEIFAATVRRINGQLYSSPTI